MLRQICLLFVALSSVNSINIDPATRMFVDDYGRTVMFHGVNIVVKQAPYIPITTYFDPQMSVNAEDIMNLTQWGVNFVRLGVMWEAVETSLGVYNMTYLEEMNTLINTLGENGIWTLVDNHQDVYARHICGEGIPNYYADNLTDTCNGLFGPLIEKLGGCTPFSSYNYTKDKNGNPEISECLTKMFALYYATPEAADGFQRIYENLYGYQDRFAEFWNVTSKFFAGNPYVVGYDMINEPLAANMVTQPWTALPGVNDLVNLQKLYKRIHEVIRSNDQNKTLFFEPIQGDLIPALGGMVFPSGFNDTPGGAEYNNRQILNDHSYCCQSNAHMCATGEPLLNDSAICAAFNYARVTTRAIDAKLLNVGLIISEFGACLDSQSCVNEITSVTSACDKNLVGWAYWMFKGFGDFTTSANLQEGFYNNQTLQEGKVKALARTYVPYYQGTPTEIMFNTITGDFTTTFALNPSVTNTTLLFASKEFYYPNGILMGITSTNPSVQCSESSEQQNYYQILCTPLLASSVTITISAR